MQKYYKQIIGSILIILLVFSLMPLSVFAKDDEYYYKNKETGYEAYVLDEEDWLTDSEKSKLLKQLIPITEFTNVVFLTDNNNSNYSEYYSESLCVRTMQSHFGMDETAVIYLIDNEYDYIASQGSARRVISSSKANSITDNVYRYSADEEYYKAATEAFSQIDALFNGRKIAEPMKYISNTFIALFIALLVNYLIVNSRSKLKQASVNEIVKNSVADLNIHDVGVQHLRTDRRYSPRSSSSGGGGGHGGGGHSGGGHSH